MIYITGDIHVNPSRFNTQSFPEQKEMTKDDYVIICGDFGLVWDYQGENKEENFWLNWLEDKPFTTLFVSGNHENYDRLESYPVEEWNGGKVQKIRPSVIHLMRGQVYEIDGKTIFTFGGASSHDIYDGIIDGDDPNWRSIAKQWDKQGKYMFRIKGKSWWEHELPTEEEMREGIQNLEKHNNQDILIVSHGATIRVLYHLLKDTDVHSNLLNISIFTPP